MEVLLVNTNRFEMNIPVLPIWMDYLGSTITSRGIRPQILDLYWEADPMEALGNALLLRRYDAVFLNFRNFTDLQFGSTYRPIDDFIEYCRLANAHSAHVIVGGSGISCVPDKALFKFFESVNVTICKGEGEASVVRILEDIRKGHVASLYRTSYPEFVDTRYQRSFADHQAYKTVGAIGNLQTKRGCPFRCTYCDYPLLEGRNLRYRSLDLIIEELEQLKAHGYDACFFTDAVGNLSLKRSKQLLQRIIAHFGERAWSLFWFFNPHQGLVDQELIELMWAAGFTDFQLGAESGSDNSLQIIGKNFRTDDIRQTIRLIRKLEDATLSLSVLFGMPGEERQDVIDSCRFLLNSGADHLSVFASPQIMAGTPLAASTKGLYWQKDEDFIYPIFVPPPDWLFDLVREELAPLVDADICRIYIGDERRALTKGGV